MEKVKNKYSMLAKIICYILIPLCAISFTTSIVSVILFMENKQDSNTNNYFETNQFANTYMSSITANTYNSINQDEELSRYSYQKIIELENSQSGIDTIYYNQSIQYKNFNYLVIDYGRKIAYTNLECTMRTDTIEKIKQELEKNKTYWNYKDKNIQTSIEKLSLENIKYSNIYLPIEKEYNCEIYTSINEELKYVDQYYRDAILYQIAKDVNKTAPINIVFSIIILIVSVITITINTGKKRGQEEVYLNWFDKIPIEIAAIIVMFITGILSFFILLFTGVTTSIYIEEIWSIILIFIEMIVIYISLAVSYDTFIKRLKSNTIFKNTITYMAIKGIIKIGKSIFKNLNLALKLGVFLGGFIVLNYILINMEFIGIMLLLGMWIYTYIWIYKKITQFIKIKETLKKIYEGDTNIELDKDVYKGVLKELCIYVNDIAGGLSNAVEQSLKSERLKTELITNVSHDIKTPLTSIINYVDLLKKEEMPNDKSKEYLEILDQKSQRLKRLTEDLVEASKASSGNIKLNMEKLNIKELIKQVSGEFEDKLKENELQLIISVPEKDLYVEADSRYLYRVIENMYSNIIKYTMKNSRVYVDITQNNETVEMQLKNISKEKLNITAEELMQRFVRGEESRNTEGSGLGLSIAQSLTELQKGEFKIHLDGDLFKVTIKLKRMEF